MLTMISKFQGIVNRSDEIITLMSQLQQTRVAKHKPRLLFSQITTQLTKQRLILL